MYTGLGISQEADHVPIKLQGAQSLEKKLLRTFMTDLCGLKQRLFANTRFLSLAVWVLDNIFTDFDPSLLHRAHNLIG